MSLDRNLQLFPAPNSEREIARNASTLQSDTCTNAAEVSATPELLYAYKDYDIVRAGEVFVGVAQELGTIDVDAVLTNAVPRPPATKFIVSNDTFHFGIDDQTSM